MIKKLLDDCKKRSDLEIQYSIGNHTAITIPQSEILEAALRGDMLDLDTYSGKLSVNTQDISLQRSETTQYITYSILSGKCSISIKVFKEGIRW